MFVGFNAHITERGILSPGFMNYRQGLFDKQKSTVRSQLKTYVLDEGFLDTACIEEDWFPSIDANVFISHSHKDQELAIGFAGWLYESFGITSFIDSCVWGYADDLLNIIDRVYCVNKRKPDGSIDTYDYNKRNQSTAHVHMILNTALQKMIDKTECLVFLNTPNSLLINNVIDGSATASPWIYSELTFSQMCRKRKLSEYRRHLVHDSMHEFAQLNVKYDVSLSHLVDLKDSDLQKIWISCRHKKSPQEVLDDLYYNLGLLRAGDR